MPSDYLKLMGTEWKVRIANVASGSNGAGNPEYVGEAKPGTETSATGWRIKKITYDSDGNPTQVNWADGDSNFNNIWDNKADYTYS